MDKAQLDQIREAIVGQHIKTVAVNELTLDNGTTLTIYESDSDCCAVAWGEWEIEDKENLMAGITDIQFEGPWGETEDDMTINTALITILHNQNPLVQSQLEATDGNGGYYFSVLNLKVTIPDIEEFEFEVLSA